MNVKIKIVSLLTVVLSWHLFASSPFTVLPCSVEFPKSVKNIPQICIYYGGERFPCEVDQEGKRACFTLPIDKACTTFFFLIADTLSFESENNTIQYLKVDTDQSYKFYQMELVRAPKKRYRLPSQKGKPEKEIKDRWMIVKRDLKSDGRIPDDAIIVLLDADYVQTVREDKGFELPTIVIKDNVLEVAGSEQKLQDKAIELLLSSLDYGPLHVNAKIHTKQEQKTIMVAMSGM